MGLFKKHKKDESEDFILDFGEGNGTAQGDDEVERLSVTLWDDRKPHRPSHAMTVDEILGNTPQPEEETEEIKQEEESAEKEDEVKLVIPQDSADISSQNSNDGDNEVVAPPSIKIATENLQSAEERADALIDRLKKENQILSSKAEEVKEELETQPADVEKEAVEDPKTTAEEAATDSTAVETPAIQDVSVAEESPIPQAEIKEEKVSSEPTPAKTKLSPTAQALYDRMMAERAKMQSANSSLHTSPVPEIKEAVTEESLEVEVKETENKIETVEPPISLDFKDEDITVTSDITAEPANEETLADSIFESLNESMSSNPLSRKMERSAESLLSKCKSYVTPTSDVELPAKSIDDIIEMAERGARERLSNLYDIQNNKPVTTVSHTHEFSPFLQKTTTGADGRPVSVPVKIQDETSDGAIISSTVGNINDFQCSFADNSDSGFDGATRIIDIKSSSIPKEEPATPHVTDPVRSEVLQDLLRPIVNPTGEVEIPTTPLKFGVTEEVELPETEIKETKEALPEVEDYHSVEDVETVRTDLASQQVSVMARFIPTVVITLILAVVDIFLKDTMLSASPTAFALLNIILSAVALAINFRTLKGISSLLGGAPDIDSPTALATLCTFLYTVISSFGGNLGTAPLLAPASMLILSFNLWGKLSIIKRIRRGFSVIANNEEKKALTFVEDKLSASVMSSGAVIGDALICQGKKTTNIRDYLKNAFSEDLYEKKVAPLMLFTVIVGAVAGLLAFFVNGGVLSAITTFAAITIAGCPISAIFCCNLPLSLATKKLASYGAMLAGHPAAEAIANANAIAFDAADLFPRGTIKLYNMKVLESGAVDKYIASASAVLSAAGSPLAPIFEEILETNNEDIPVADSIKYENNMGVSGWIEDRRIFVGNRTLMEGHNIKTPSLELDKKILRQGYFPLYLACDQQLCALFVVGYEADEEITYELRNLCNTGVTMLINSNDPNVSEEMLCDYFGLYPDLVKVMSGTGVAAYKNVGAYTESLSATASYGDDICGFLSAVTSSIRMRGILNVMLIIQLLLFVLGFALTGYFIFTSSIMSLPTLGILGFQLLGALITSVAAHLRKP